jgi:hypothetical protein
MSADRELLELAARAAGLEGYEYTDGYTNAFYAGSRFYMTQPDMHTPWNPLDDDGDALRLAVKLDISVIVNRRDMTVRGRIGRSITDPLATKYIAEDLGDDEMAATRRAIVRAAAEIERSM